MLSPFEIPPLPRIGRWMTRIVHGNRRSSQGYLLTGRHYLDEEQEWRLGQCYLGLLGLPLFLLLLLYVFAFYPDLGHWRGRRHFLGPWSSLPLDLKIMIPLGVVGHIAALGSLFRLAFFGRIGRRDEIGE